MRNFIRTYIPANYFRSIESVGGKLYFDEFGITFRSHFFNIQTGDTRINYAMIDSAERGRGFAPNKMSVFTKDGFEHKFIVSNRDDIIEFLEYMKNVRY